MHYYTLLLLLSFILAHKLVRFIMTFSYISPLPHGPSPLWLVPSHPPNPRFHSHVTSDYLCLCLLFTLIFFISRHNFLSEKPLLVNSPSSLIFLSVLETESHHVVLACLAARGNPPVFAFQVLGLQRRSFVPSCATI